MANTTASFTGIWPAMVTPYDGNLEISPRGIKALVARLVEDGAAGLFVGGSTGEGVLLSVDERKRLADLTVKAVAGQIPVMVHVGAPATRDAVELAIHARKIGAAAVSSVAPIYYPVSVEAAFAYYHEVAAAGELPFFCYVFRGKGIESVSIEQFVEKLMKVPHIGGVKYTSFEMNNIARMKFCSGGKLSVFSGYDECFLAAKAQGADGAVGSFYNAFLPRWERVRRTFEAGKWVEARDAMIKAVDVTARLLPFGLDGLKHVLRLKGIEVGTVRGPLPRINDEQKRRIQEILKSLEE